MDLKDIVGDYGQFYNEVCRQLLNLGTDITGFQISHIAYCSPDHSSYQEQRTRIESLCRANVESVWKGRAISKLLLKEPLLLSDGTQCPLFELIPPPHKPGSRTGLEHVGFMPGEKLDNFLRQHDDLCYRDETGKQSDPPLIRFDDGSAAKFYRHSLRELCEMDGHRFDGFYHASS